MSFHRLLGQLKQIAIGVDQLVNTLLGGWADETLSARLYREELNGKLWARVLRPVVDVLFFFDPDHCETSYYYELNRMQYPKEYRS